MHFAGPYLFYFMNRRNHQQSLEHSWKDFCEPCPHKHKYLSVCPNFVNLLSKISQLVYAGLIWYLEALSGWIIQCLPSSGPTFVYFVCQDIDWILFYKIFVKDFSTWVCWIDLIFGLKNYQGTMSPLSSPSYIYYGGIFSIFFQGLPILTMLLCWALLASPCLFL